MVPTLNSKPILSYLARTGAVKHAFKFSHLKSIGEEHNNVIYIAWARFSSLGRENNTFWRTAIPSVTLTLRKLSCCGYCEENFNLLFLIQLWSLKVLKGVSEFYALKIRGNKSTRTPLLWLSINCIIATEIKLSWLHSTLFSRSYVKGSYTNWIQ